MDGVNSLSTYPQSDRKSPAALGLLFSHHCYIGHTVLHRSVVTNFKLHKRRETEEAEQYVFPNTHEAIISQELWDSVHRRIKRVERASPWGSQYNRLSGYLYCADCGRRMSIIQGVVSSIMNAAGFGAPNSTVLPAEIVTAIEDCGFFESIPLWAVTLIGGLFIWVLSFVMILSVYGRFFKMFMYAALAPIPLSSFAGGPSQNVGKSFLKSYAAVCLEGAVIVLACIIFSVFASAPPTVDPDAAAASMVWSYIGEVSLCKLLSTMIIVAASSSKSRTITGMVSFSASSLALCRLCPATSS